MGLAARTRALSAIPMACWAMIGVATVQAQNIVSRPPSFQAPGQRSLQNEILDRLATTGQFQPDDVPRLARLVVLNSMAMLVDVRADLNQTTIGNDLGADIIDLSEASELYYESVSATSLDSPDIARALQLYEAVEQSYRRVDSTLGELPGLSRQAAVRLRDVSRLLNVLSPVNAQLEANLPATFPVPVPRSNELDKVAEADAIPG